MRLRSIFLSSACLLTTALLPATSRAQVFCNRPPRCQPCPPSCLPQPCPSPAAPSPEPSSPTEPKRPSEEQPPAPAPEAPALPELASGVQGGRGLAYSSPNMFGEFFGARSFRLTLQLPSTQVPTPPPPPPPQPPPTSGVTVLAATTTIPGRIVTIDVPSAAGGGVVERTKISEENSPLPRDRVFFTYDYFNRVPLNGDVNVHGFVLGFEKTFCDKLASIEVRVPFASTLDPSVVEGGTGSSRDGELGDVHFTFKGLLWSTPVLNVAAGIGVSIPTGPDTRFTLQDGTFLGRITNDSVIVTPYVAYLVTPDDRWFFQNWFQIGFDAGHDSVELNPALATINNAGHIRDQSILQIDAQLGYWLYKSNDANRWLTALAPFIELHYNTSLDNADSLHVASFSLASTSNHFDELNLSTGVVAQIGDNCTLALGAAFPLKGDNNRSFDYQLGIRANIFFGPTARERNRATFVP